MKAHLLRSLVVTAALAAAAHAQTINWGSEVYSTLLGSNGAAMAQDGYTFELGTFSTGFTPADSNILEWQSNWTRAGEAAYRAENGYFTGSLVLTTSTLDLKQAYLWIHNSFDSAAQDWLLVTDSNWVFPAYDPSCCSAGLPLEWSVSDVDTEATPLWGANTATSGSGAATADSVTPTLQSHLSIFAWTIDDDNPTGYNTLPNQNLTGEDAVFKVVLPEGDSYTEAFWDIDREWTDIFNVASGADLADIFSGGYTGSGGIPPGGLVDGQGYFTLNGNTLSWTAIPEPTGAVVGLLLAVSALRRRRVSKPCSPPR